MKPSMTSRNDNVSLYLHVAFCDRRCHFCGFFTRARRDDRVAAFASDLMAEIQLNGRKETLRGQTSETIYFSCRTPTALTSEQLLSAPEASPRRIAPGPAALASIEANP